MLEARALTYGVGGSALQRELTFSLAPGQVLHVRGPNGSGKSLLLRVIQGLHAPFSGELHSSFPHSTYLPQMQSRFAHLPFTLEEVLGTSPIAGLLPQSSLGRAWNTASGGERQRVLLARFFAQAQGLLLLDEPFNHLDQSSRRMVQELLRACMREPGRAAILVSHDDSPAQWLDSVTTFDLPEPEDES